MFFHIFISVRKNSSATRNIVELLKEQLLKSPEACDCLPIAACLGGEFSWNLLVLALNSFATEPSSRKVYEDTFGRPLEYTERSIMDTIVAQGFVEESSRDDHYSFVHDRVQEASLDIIPSENMDKLKFKLGSILRETLTQDDLEANLFTVVSLLNSRASLIPKEATARLDIVKLNMSIGDKAVASGAFHTALSFLEKAIYLFPSKALNDHQQLYIDLYSSATECAWAVIGSARARQFARSVLELSCAVIDKMRVIFVMMDTLLRDTADDRVSYSDAVGVAKEILELLGLKLPKTSIGVTGQTIKGMLRAKRRPKGRDLRSYDDLCVVTDPMTLALARILDKFTNLAYLASKPLVPLIIFETTYITLEHGITPQSASSFAWVGSIVTSFLGDFEAGRYYIKAATKMLEKLQDNKAARGRALFVIDYFLRHWIEPTAFCHSGLLEGYRLAMSSGDTANADLLMNGHLFFCYHSGKPLPLIDEDAVAFVSSLNDSEQQYLKNLWFLHRQLFQNLRVPVENTTSLVGSIFDESAFLQPGASGAGGDDKDNLLMAFVFGTKISLCMYWGEFQAGADIALQWLKIILREQPGQITCKSGTFHGGVCAFAASHYHNNKGASLSSSKYKRFARQCLKRLSGWMEKGDPNVIQQVLILRAEEAWMSGRIKTAVDNFERGIAVAGRSGWIHEQALANERLASLWKDQGNLDNANYRLSEAIRLYKEWGALAKVQALQGGDEPEPPSTISVQLEL